jgi:hypothetical protein
MRPGAAQRQNRASQKAETIKALHQAKIQTARKRSWIKPWH